ncbi:MAG: AbrB family transcriptional regulator [Leptothrix sp. (in: b-proteobacteria)]
MSFPAPWRAQAPRLLRIALTLLVASTAALLCVRLHTPLPWMIGPLLSTALLSILDVPLASSRRVRNAGQWVVGTALGLYFTPVVAAQVLVLAPWTLLGTAWALLMGHLFYRWLLASQPAGAVDRSTAYFASVIGGASEMAGFAERLGARVDLVAAAHSLRVLVVVITLPFGYQFAQIHGQDTSLNTNLQTVQPFGLLLLGLATLAGAQLMQRLRQPNPWVLGSLAASLALTASGVQLSALPGGLMAAAQLGIGVSLGTRFTARFVHTAPRWLAAVAAGTLGMILLSAGFAWIVARLADLNPAAVLLGNSPGGITEMCLTAKVLQLGVPLVTAFHIVRYVIVLVLTGPIHRRWIAK